MGGGDPRYVLPVNSLISKSTIGLIGNRMVALYVGASISRICWFFSGSKTSLRSRSNSKSHCAFDLPLIIQNKSIKNQAIGISRGKRTRSGYRAKHLLPVRGMTVRF